MSDVTFKGYAIHDTNKWSEFKVIDFKPKTAEDYDVDIAIEYCGVCGSDVHTITGGWGAPDLPVIPGHEIVGTVTRVGPKVTEFKVGDKAGVGAQVCSCFKCNPCKTNNEQYCRQLIDTYNAKYPNGDVAQGGYSSGIRAHERYVFPIPPSLELKSVAPMLCAGITVFSPLVRNGAKPGAKVGIVGLGGLGHFAVMFAKALGCAEVVVFSHTENKKDDAHKLGATKFVNTGSEGFAEPLADSLDLIVSTADISKGIPLAELVSTLNVHGRLIICGIPDEPLPAFKTPVLAVNGAMIGGSHIGSKVEVLQMLKLAADHKLQSWIEELPMSQCGKAVENLKENKVHYRHVLKMDL